MSRAKALRPEFGPDTSFEVEPRFASPVRGKPERALDKLKTRLLRESFTEYWDRPGKANVRRAANEAAALAWMTPYPLLVFPALFEEKMRETLMRAERQEQVRRLTRELLTV